MEGGELIFNMGSEPNKFWGSKDDNVPKTFISENLIVPVPYFIAAGLTFSTSKKIEIKSIVPDSKIYYTIDGSVADSTKLLYTKPFEINETTTINAISYKKGLGKSYMVSSKYIKIPEGRSIKLNVEYSPNYTAGGPNGLIDYIRGSKNFRLGAWQGYNGKDFEAVIDLGKIQDIKTISAGFLQDVGAWIWMPSNIEYSVSDNGFNYTVISNIQNDIPDNDYTVLIKDFTSNVNSKGRYVRVKAKNYGTIPSWHAGVGNPSWIFIDEIIVE
jgi:hypothetical protein